MKHPFLFPAAIGLVIFLACSGVGGPTLAECPEHTACSEDLMECMCDADGALHTAEGFCTMSFDPPCPASEECAPKPDKDCDMPGDAQDETGFIPG